MQKVKREGPARFTVRGSIALFVAQRLDWQQSRSLPGRVVSEEYADSTGKALSLIHI